MEAKKIGAIVLAILFVVVMFQNWDEVTTEILWMEFALPQIVLMFLSALVGFIVGAVFMRSRMRKK